MKLPDTGESDSTDSSSADQFAQRGLFRSAADEN